jgi:hypothetical protein
MMDTIAQAPRAEDARLITGRLASLIADADMGEVNPDDVRGLDRMVTAYLAGEAERLPARAGSPEMRVVAAIPVTWGTSGQAEEVIAVVEQSGWPRDDMHYGTVRAYRNDLDDGTVRWSATGGHYDYRELTRAARGMASRTGITVVWPDPAELDTEAKILAQRQAEMMWKVATAEDHAITWYKSPVYRHQELAFMATVQIAYGCSRMIAHRVRSLLSEYGPDDSLQGTTGRGIYSYVQFARANSRSDYHY